MPQFCRHNRLVQNCPICSRELDVELRPLVSSSAARSLEPGVTEPRPARRRQERRGPSRSQAAAGLSVRRLRNTADDGYRSPLVPGLKSSEEARRLVEELAFAETRLQRLRDDPPGLYAEVADSGGDLEERTWLAFLIAYLGPLEAEADPFAAIRAARTSWHSGELPRLEGISTGPRAAHGNVAGTRTIESYRSWAMRAGSQAAALGGEEAWQPERRFARIYERLALPGMRRDARYELLTSLGCLGVYALRAASLQLGGDDLVTVAAKRALGIGDQLLLERRAAQLANAAGVELQALDLGFFNWERGQRATVGIEPGADVDAGVAQAVGEALGL